MTKGRELKPHIGIFGRGNNGKSSLINLLAGQDIAIVSEHLGTTTDPVRKSIEIFGVGPVVMVDTAGFDDAGELGLKRVKKTKEVLKSIDLAILIIAGDSFGDVEASIIRDFRQASLPFFFVHNKSDLKRLSPDLRAKLEELYQVPLIEFSCKNGGDTGEIISMIQKMIPETAYKAKVLIGDLISKGDVVLLITPIDLEAPEGRMILPQVMVIRDVLDHDGIAVVCKEKELDSFIGKMNPRPMLVITDSQAFLKVDAAIPKDIPLTSFSIVLARQKGDFYNYMKGAPHLSELRDGDKVLILESCTHQLSCDDIGRVKIPGWLGNFTGKKLEFEVISGMHPLPDDLKQFAIVIQCGGCVLTARQIHSRIRPFVEAGVPVTNYGMAIAWVHGIFKRAIAPFATLEQANDYL